MRRTLPSASQASIATSGREPRKASQMRVWSSSLQHHGHRWRAVIFGRLQPGGRSAIIHAAALGPGRPATTAMG